MPPFLSTRGVGASDPNSGENIIWQVISNLHHPDTNPDGFISLGVAENALMHEELARFLSSRYTISTTGFTYGDGPSGSKQVVDTLARFFNKFFNPVNEVKKEHIMVTNGVSSAVEHFSWALANLGDGILLGRPYYRTFISDIGLRTGVNVVPVSFGATDPFGIDAIEKYEEALKKSEKEGVKIRALVLCHPHNPLGRCYSREAIIGLMRFCQKHKIHLLSDEIYALSVWENKVDVLEKRPEGFVSALSIDTTGIIDASLVHVLWGMSKDFGANGIRLGVLVSQANTDFLSACKTCGLYSSPSSLAENAVSQILGDDKFVEQYVRQNQERLSEAHKHAAERLKGHGIEYNEGVNATFFLWINLGRAWREKHPEDADKLKDSKFLFKKLMAEKVFLVEGEAAGAEEPGWFRLVFSQPRESVEEGISRIIRVIESK
ncbi:hypothetical protein AAF712_008615 [Marasmius tenuissimus]|uniref:Aminotransferase class I/classII large domain-containing protein n=1 Tax=Marasmius tenuissimus TaxID=585030 RepID=A0ABR2ZSA0_9AGAR